MPLVDGKVLRKMHEPGDLPLFDCINSLRKLGELTANGRTNTCKTQELLLLLVVFHIISLFTTTSRSFEKWFFFREVDMQ